jgi:imidazole glycerol-phosphate synthase subunit HisH
MVVIVDYGMGNVRSVIKAFEAIGAEAMISNQAEEIRQADRLVLPGVGAFAEGMNHLKRLNLIELLTEEVKIKGKPFLGICLGMQMLAAEGHEDGVYSGLNWLPAKTVMFDIRNRSLKLPHIGWNEVYPQNDNSLFQGLGPEPTFYFVHSYHIVCDPAMVGSTCIYGQPFVASIQINNIFGTQFHPEKSQKNGLQVLRNFMAI